MPVGAPQRPGGRAAAAGPAGPPIMGPRGDSPGAGNDPAAQGGDRPARAGAAAGAAQSLRQDPAPPPPGAGAAARHGRDARPSRRASRAAHSGNGGPVVDENATTATA